MSRFIRDFELLLIPPDRDPIVVRPPQRITFSCDKSTIGGLNRLNIQTFNMSVNNRIAKDPEQRIRVGIILRVGYQGAIETIFQGTVHKGSIDRDGPDIVNSIEALDGGEDYLSGHVSATVRTKDEAIDAILAELPNTKRGKVTELKAITRPKVLIGNPLKVLTSLLQPDETFYIDNEQLFIIKKGEVTQSYIPLVSPRTGLLNTPQRENQKITFETLMNPALKLGAQCDLQSTTAEYLNGVIKIESMNYSGDSDGSDWKQSVSGLSGGFTVLQ